MSSRSEVEKWRSALASFDLSCSRKDRDDVTDAFSRDLSFGTGGIRGIMGIGPNRMNELTIGRASQGLADYLLSMNDSALDVVIAYDTRNHSLEFARATACVLSANGIRVHIFSEPVPTPVLSYAVRVMHCSAGVSITASHNPKEYNGYKVYSSTGDQLTDAAAHRIQSYIELIDPFEGIHSQEFETGLNSGMINWVNSSIFDGYLESVLSQIKMGKRVELNILYSPLHGAGLSLARRLLGQMGVSYSIVREQSFPDGSFPGCPKPNPEDPDAMQLGMRELIEGQYDIFVANDPDADRIGVAVNHGGEAVLLSGNEVGLLLLDYLAKTRETHGSKAFTTIVSSPLADTISRYYDIELLRTLTGFKYIGEQIDCLDTLGKERDFLFAFEESCGYLAGSYVRDKDGIIAIALVTECAEYYKSRGMTLIDALDELYDRFGYMMGRQVSRGYEGVEGRLCISRMMRRLRFNPPAEFAGLKVERIIDYSKGVPMPSSKMGHDAECGILPAANVVELKLGSESKIIFRPSGTEPKLKAYVFAGGTTRSCAESGLQDLVSAVEHYIDESVEKMRDGSEMAHIVLLSGGSGSRLWPLSNAARSKQFLKVLRNDSGEPISMVQRVFNQIEAVEGNLDITIATSALQAESLLMQIGGSFALVTEPERRDTAAAIMLACSHLLMEQAANPDDVVIVMPIDTYAGQGYYDKIPQIASAVRSGKYDLVLLGVKPTYPSEKYGYIIPEDGGSDGMAGVQTFKEKPSEVQARDYIARGGLWNCGVFGFKLGYLLELVKGYYCPISYEDLLEHYSELPKISFDYEVVEHASSIGCISYDGVWKDLGTWSTLTEEMAENVSGRAVIDDSCQNVHVINETSLPLAVAGLKDAVVAATPDGILVTSKKQSAHIKGLVSSVSGSTPMYEEKSWGHYRITELESNAGCRIEELRVKKEESARVELRKARTVVLIVVNGFGSINFENKVARYSPAFSRTFSNVGHLIIDAEEQSTLLLIEIG